MKTRNIVAAVAVVMTGAIGAQAQSFDTGLSEFLRQSGSNLGCAFGDLEAVGTQDGDDEISVNVQGPVTEAWLYWVGETNRDADGNSEPGDPSIALEHVETGQRFTIEGTEVGRRFQLFSDEGQGGELVMKGAVPSSAFDLGPNTFMISNFNERLGDPDNPNKRWYRRQYGVSLMAIFEQDLNGDHEVIGLEGADVANHGRYAPMAGFEEQANSDLHCFDFAAVDCDTTAALDVAIAGVNSITPDNLEDVDGSGESMFIESGSGAPPLSIIGTGNQVSTNTIADPSGFYKGRAMAVFQGQIDLTAGDSRACFQNELLPNMSGQIGQNFVIHAALLGIDRECPVSERQVDVRIRPNNGRRICRRCSRRYVVAILSEEGFDANAEVDKDSLTLGRTGDENSVRRCSVDGRDVNNDGLLDLVCRFRADKARGRRGDRQFFLKGTLNDGTPIFGSDDVFVGRRRRGGC